MKSHFKILNNENNFINITKKQTTSSIIESKWPKWWNLKCVLREIGILIARNERFGVLIAY